MCFVVFTNTTGENQTTKMTMQYSHLQLDEKLPNH